MLNRLLLIIICLSFAININATGPSWISSLIRPISINEKGDILCKTRFQKNDMGGHYYMPIQYGLCVISKSQMLEYPTDSIHPSIINIYDKDNIPEGINIIDDDIYFQIQQEKDSLFNSPMNFNNLSGIEKQICEQYDFTSNNVDKYKTDQKLDITTFSKKKNVDLKKLCQKALQEATEDKKSEWNNNFLCIGYDFGDVLIVDNVSTYEDYEILDDSQEARSCGPEFTYVTFYTGNNGEHIGYDISEVTGVLFLK